MKATIEPGRISGSITPPPSKSLTQRALAAALLHKGTTVIHNAGLSADELAATGIIQQLGATVTETISAIGQRTLTIESNGVQPVSGIIHCGESGLAARMFAPIAALHNEPVTLTGTGSLLTRPLTGITKVLASLGVSVSSNLDHLPITLTGPLAPANTEIDASGSSQLLSGLLFALTAVAHAPITLKVKGLVSKPYIDLTIDVLMRFGRRVRHTGYKYFYIDPQQFTYEAHREITIESDWSSASCLLVAGAIAGEITINNLSPTSLQADRKIMKVLDLAGANVQSDGNQITVFRSSLQAFEFDATHCPDLFPAIAVLAAFCRGESIITGLHRLFHKESNRVESITELLWSFGIPCAAEDDALFVEGGERLNGTVIDSYNDHRIVMAAAVCALRARSRVDINGAEAVNKSYPSFFTDMTNCGMNCVFSD
jgi:3-phosphoshikimate 1-carboxyvinyltransferase